MNNNTNDDLKAGPKMDSRVAVTVFKLTLEDVYNGGFKTDNERIAGRYGDAIPAYSRDIKHAFEMEAELDRRGLQLAYIHELFHVVIMNDLAAHSSFLWRIAHASPEQRCRAALACVEDK